ncbi:MAG: DNA replication and repair protein RecF [Chitinophagaceae bacterium]|nr:DNA replication and repair protein RecF [Chitinophagaceae bacterium]
MLFLEEIELVQFRNYTSQKNSFTERIIGICGANGTGKTNLLDAIYYLSFSRSYFSRTDVQNVQHGMQGMRIAGKYMLQNETTAVQCILRENNKKELWVEEEQYKKISDHIGKFPAVMIAPDDISLITGGSEERRTLIDTILSQTNPIYLKSLINYNKILQQRNAFLKQYEYPQIPDEKLLQVFNEQLTLEGNIIYEIRKKFMDIYIPLVQKFYEQIAGLPERISLTYESQLHEESFSTLLSKNLQKDLALQRSNTGIHKDDISFTLYEYPFKMEASQGQRKSLLFSLKLAEWDYLKMIKGFAPILLLDDVFEKLDANRMFHLLMQVCSKEGGQVFITDTHADRLSAQLAATGTPYQLITLS